MTTGVTADARTGVRPVAGAAGAAVAVLALSGVAVATGSQAWTMVVAGALLLAAGFVIMAPCQLQMAAMFTVVVRNTAARQAEASGPAHVRRAAVRFALGYLTLYVPVAVVLGGAAWLLADYGWVLTLAGAALSTVLGLAALGRLPRSWLSQCRGPLGLLRSGKASFSRPFPAGVAFGKYCATCCGPYVYALVVLAGATGAFAFGAGLVMAYAVVMVVPFLLPALLAPATYTAVADRVSSLSPVLGRATGMALVGLGAVLVPVGVLSAVG